jgi:predicted RNA binding protein YcfA (HicA-like mRNA interferase family)
MKVRDVIKPIESDGWYFKRMRGDHRVYHHPMKLGLVVVAGQPRDDVPIGTLGQIFREAGLKKNG